MAASLDCKHAQDLTAAQCNIVQTITGWEDVSTVEVWNEDEEMGISYVSDGARMLGYFDTAGNIVGDWIV